MWRLTFRIDVRGRRTGRPSGPWRATPSIRQLSERRPPPDWAPRPDQCRWRWWNIDWPADWPDRPVFCDYRAVLHRKTRTATVGPQWWPRVGLQEKNINPRKETSKDFIEWRFRYLYMIMEGKNNNCMLTYEIDSEILTKEAGKVNVHF